MSDTKSRPWKQAVAEHEKPSLRASSWQLANTLIPYLALWGLMIWTLQVSYRLTLAIAVPAAAFLVQFFIIFHDCGHGFRGLRIARGARAPFTR